MNGDIVSLLERRDPTLALIVGDAQFVVEEVVKQALVWAEPLCAPAGFNKATYRCDSGNSCSALATARTPPMMARKRVVVISEVELASREFMDELLHYVRNPVSSTFLLVTGRELTVKGPGSKKVLAELKQRFDDVGVVVSYTNRDISPTRFCMDRAQHSGKKLEFDAARLLVEMTGQTLGHLAMEVEKCCVYVGSSPTIGVEAVHEICSLTAEAVVWDLTTALAVRDADTALASVHRLLEDGDSAHRLLGVVMWQLRELMKVGELLTKGASEQEILSSVRMRRGQFKAVVAGIKRSGLQSAVLLERVAKANQDMNAHRAGERKILEKLVVELCCS